MVELADTLVLEASAERRASSSLAWGTNSNMLKFKKPFKIYIFKERNQVDLAIRVNDHYVQTYTMSIEHMETIINNWNTGSGFEGKINGQHWSINHKTYAPRPVCNPVTYVRLTISNHFCSHNFRVEFGDMLELEKDFFYQKNNKMYWDAE